MTQPDQFFPDDGYRGRGGTGIQRARNFALKKRQHNIADMVWSGDPARLEAAMNWLKQKILAAVPPGTQYLEALMNISSYKWSAEIESAGITCEARPEFHINPDFVDRYCIFESDLRMLILHELSHILYGHHVLCGTTTPHKNIAFDAVINARLCKVWMSRVHGEFFRHVYPHGAFPEILLCPPPGWPDDPDDQKRSQERLQLLRSVDMKRASRIVMLRNRLYDPVSDVGFEEVLDLVLELSPTRMPLLLGNHTLPVRQQGDTTPPARSFLHETAQRVWAIMEKQTERSRSARGWDYGHQCSTIQVPSATPRADFLKALRGVLARAGVFNQRFSTRRRRNGMPVEREVCTPLPQWRDRTQYARAALTGIRPLLYRGANVGARIAWETVGEAHVYLDVSGSMRQDLPWITGALRPLQRNGLCRIFLFSTIVADLPPGIIGRKGLDTSGGTCILCVLEHLITIPAHKRPRHAVVLTDGFFALPRHDNPLMKRFKESGIALHGALTPSGAPHPINHIAASVTQLPAYK